MDELIEILQAGRKEMLQSFEHTIVSVHMFEIKDDKCVVASPEEIAKSAEAAIKKLEKLKAEGWMIWDYQLDHTIGCIINLYR